MRIHRNHNSKLRRVMKSNYTLDKYIVYLKRVEGYKNRVGDTFYPYESPEGGLKTIGYGYKIKSLEEQNVLEKTGMSDYEVEEKLIEEAGISLYKAERYCNKKNYDWSKIDKKLKYALADICFNVGSLRTFPTTTKCLSNNDVMGAVDDDPTRKGFKHYERTFKDADGNRRGLARNKIFYKEFLESYVEKE